MAQIDGSEFILKDSYNYTFMKRKKTSVPAYILHKFQKNATLDKTSVGITNGVTGAKILYRDFESISRRVASCLFKRGFRKGDTLIYAASQEEMLHVFLLGAWRANGILRASYREDYGETLVRRIEESQARWILCDDDIVDKILETLDAVPWAMNVVVFGNCPKKCIPVSTFFDDDGQDIPELKLTGEDIAVILPTSGTGGKSKGAVHTHGRLVRYFQVENKAHGQTDPSRVFLHIGIGTNVLAFLAFRYIAFGEGLVRLQPGSTPERVFKAIQDYKPYGMVAYGPYLLKVVGDPKMSDYDLTSIRYISLAGTIHGPHLIATIKDSFPSSPDINNIYGTTEILGVTSAASVSTKARKKIEVFDSPPLSTGKLLPSVQLAVVDPESLIAVGPNQNGELWFKSDYNSIGYFNNEKETLASFQNGWNRTGDLGYYDMDGFVYVISRLKEVFTHCGNHVSPSEIEDVLMLHPLVDQACVIPVEEPNGRGWMPKGYVVLKEGVNTGHDEAIADIIKFINPHLQVYQQLKGGLEIRQKFSYGPGGKIQRHLLKENFQK